MAKRTKNPAPPFKPSKKFQKQFPKWEETIKRRETTLKKKVKTSPKAAKRVSYLDEYLKQYQRRYFRRHKPLTYLDRLAYVGDLAERGKYRDVFKADLPRGELYDRIAVLSNVAGGIDEAAEILDTSIELIDDAISGARLNRLQDDELNEMYSHFARHTDEQELFGINIEAVETDAMMLREIERQINAVGGNEALAAIFRKAVAYGDVDLDKLKEARFMFGDLTAMQAGKILEAWDAGEFEGKIDLNEIFSMYVNSEDSLDESEFWAWFRELFY